MTENSLSDKTVRSLRIVAFSLGILMLIAAGFANVTGISTGDGFSKNQIGFLVAGLFLITAGVLGRKFLNLYKQFSIMLFNLIITLFILEFFSIALVKIIDHEHFSTRRRKIEEGHLELVENNTVLGLYAPFVVWRSNPALNSDTVTVDETGYRITPGISTEANACKVFLLGGSAMWGTNVADSGTIGAHLQQLLTESRPFRPAAVSNLAQTGHSSTQEIIELVLQLRSGNIPDVVIFYDGFNDVWGAYEAGRAGTHHSERAIAAHVEGRPEAFNNLSPFEAIIRETNTWLLISSIRRKSSNREDNIQMVETYHTMGVNSDSLARDIVSTYMGNSMVVQALAEHYGFEYFFIWQPSVWFGEKHLTEYEERIVEGGFEFFLAGGDPAFKRLYNATFRVFEESIADSSHYLSFARIFDNITETVYNDYSGVHVDSWANRILAEELTALIIELDQQSEIQLNQ